MEGQPEEQILNEFEEGPQAKLRDPFEDSVPNPDEIAKHAREVYGLDVGGEDIQVIE